MPYKKVKTSISELKGELAQVPVETQVLQGKLEQVSEHIESYTPDMLKELVQFLKNEADEFEVEHPQITAMINQLLTTLSNMGI